jgi:DNA-3-methyladenine glycosylase II
MKSTDQKKITHLSKSDPILAVVIKKAAHLIHAWDSSKRPKHFKALIVAIINQQLSGKAADTIQKRFEALFANASQLSKTPKRKSRSHKKFPTPEDVLRMPAAKLRKVGLSGMKISFMKDLSKKVLDGTVNFRAMKKWSDEEVIEHLVQVKGIGRWTAEMFLMFSLGREDVFSYGDLGLRNAMQKLYKLRAHPTPTQAEKIAEKWSPYRSLASRYLWASLEIE